MDKEISTLLQQIKSATGWSEPRIASEIGTSQPTVNRILNGQADCKGRTWRAIEELHSVVCAAVGPPSHPLTTGDTDALTTLGARAA